MKMRKIISLVLALAFIFSMAVPAMAAPSAQEIAGERLLSLSVIDGYPGGGLGLDKTITRAEVAVVLAKISGMGSAADLLKDTPSKFKDVKPNEWYTGWVNLASSQGWVKGDPQGTFRPNDPVQYREMVTMLLKALGYNDNLPGDWPTNYLAKAASLGITKGIVSDAKAHAVRGDVFIMTSRTLNEKTVVFDKDYNEFLTGKILLEAKMKFEKVEGIVTDIARTSSLKDNQIRIDGKVYKVVGPVDYEAVFGTEVKAWLNDDEEVVFIDIESDGVYVDAIEWNSSKEELKLVDANVKYDLAKNVKVFINGSSDKVSSLGAKYNYAKVVLNKDGDVAFIDAYSLNNFLVVEKVDGNYVYGYGDEINAKDYSIVKDGQSIALADVEKGDIFFYSTAGDGFAEVFNKSVEGEIERIYDNSIKVAGKEYKRDIAKYLNEDDKVKSIDSSSLLKDIAEAMKDAGKVAVFVNRAGDMVFLSGDIGDLKTSSSYVFVTADSSQFNDRGTLKWTLDVLNAQGTEVKYDISNKDAEIDSDVLKAINGNPIKWDNDGNASNGTTNIVKNRVVEIKLDNAGKIDEVGLVFAHPKEVNKEIKTTEKYYAGAKINSDAVVYLIDEFIKPNGKVKDIEIKQYKDLDFDYIKTATFYEKDDKIVAIVVEASSRKDDSVTHLTVATADDAKVAGKTQYTLKLVLNGEKVTVDTKVDISNYPGVNKGDLLEVKVDKKTGNVNEVSKLNSSLQAVAADKVAELNTANKSLKIGSTSGLKLGVDGVVVDATDSYKVISLSSLKNGDTVKALRVANGSNYLDVIVRTAKAGDTSSDPTASGVIAYKNAAGKFVDSVKLYNGENLVLDVVFTNEGAKSVSLLANAAKATLVDSDGAAVGAVTNLNSGALVILPGKSVTFDTQVSHTAPAKGEYTLLVSIPISAEETIESTLEVEVVESNNADLSALVVSGSTLDPVFAADKTAYTVKLPASATGSKAITTATAAGTGATVVKTDASDVKGTLAERTATAKVTAEDGTVKTYTVVFVVNSKPTVANAIADITKPANGGNIVVDLAGVFADADEDTLTYSVSKDADASSAVTSVIVSDGKVIIVPHGTNTGTVTITVTANDGVDTITDSFDVILQ